MKQQDQRHRTLLRTTQIAMASAAFALLAACGGGGGNSASNTPPAGVNMQVVSFGTSLSDAGTYEPIALGFGGGRFTTNPGEVWTQKVAEYFGNTMTPAFEGGFGSALTATGGLNYAQGGAQVSVGGDFTSATATEMPITWQITQYLSQHPSFNANQIVLVDGGANEILDLMTSSTSLPTFLQGLMSNTAFMTAFGTYQASPTSANQVALVNAMATYLVQDAPSDPLVGNIVAAASTLATQIQTNIIGKGAAHVVVMDVPDVGQTPAGLAVAQGVATADPAVTASEVSSVLTLIAAAYNGMLSTQLNAQITAGQVVWVDALSWMDGVLANASAEGFVKTNNGTACDLGGMQQNATSFFEANPSAIPGGVPAGATVAQAASAAGASFASSLFCSSATLTVPGADQTYVFADQVHPTTHTHALFAQLVEQKLAAAGVGKAPQ